MQKKSGFLTLFIVFLLLSLLIFFGSKTGFLKPVNSLFQIILSPFEVLTYGIFSKITSLGSDSEIKSLKAENAVLVKKLVDQNRLIGDNKAFKDQFQTQNPKSTNLMPADVIGAPSFIPGVSVPETLTLDRGETDGVKTGNAVIYKDNLIGKVVKTSAYLSSVMLITNFSSSFTVKILSNQSLGVLKGQGGGEMVLDNVLLSEVLKKDDIILTKGDINQKGEGLEPDLIVGKITSISKNPSDLFQKAEVKSLVNFTNLNKVFIITNL